MVAVATPCWPGAGFGDDARLAHAPREQRLADHVVDLVRAGVIEVLALQPDLRAAKLARPALRVIHRRGTSDVVLELALELRDELRIAAIARVLRLELVERANQRLGDEHAAIRAEVATRVGMTVKSGEDQSSAWRTPFDERCDARRHP